MPNTREKEKLIKLLDNFNRDLSPYAGNSKLFIVDDNCELADYLIANGVTVQEWIPVSEPPKERGCYLISVKHWLDGKPVTREAFWNGADWLSCYWKKGDRVELTPRVTHWMPLPTPPKGE